MCFSFVLKSPDFKEIRKRAELKRFRKGNKDLQGLQSHSKNSGLDPESSCASKGHNEVGYCAFRSELVYNINMEEMNKKDSEKYTGLRQIQGNAENSVAKMRK